MRCTVCFLCHGRRLPHCLFVFFLMIRRPPRSTLDRSSAASDVYKRQELGIVQKSGSWYSYNNDKLGQGRDSVKQLMVDNPELAKEIEGKIREKIKEMQSA